jgi:ribose-phosphate pyrophosphokinase
MKIITANSNLPLADKIVKQLNTPLTKANITRFADEEISVTIEEYVRNQEVFLIQSTSKPANDNLMEMLITIDSLKRSSAKKISVVIPYYGYCRQDRKNLARSPISAKLVANLITTAGADHVIMIDLHAEQIQGFFDIPVDNIYSLPIIAADIKKNFDLPNTVIVSPDVGAVIRSRNFAHYLGCSLAIIDKRREKAGVSHAVNVIGDVRSKKCILVDDIVDSAGTICNAAEALFEGGANYVCAYATHGVLSGSAVKKIDDSKLQKLTITDTIDQSNIELSKKINVISVAPLLAEVISRINKGVSLANLYD